MEEILVEFIGGPLDGREEMEIEDGGKTLRLPLLVFGHEEGLYMPTKVVEGSGCDYCMRWITTSDPESDPQHQLSPT